MVALSIFFSLKADYRFRHMQKVEVIRIEQARPITLERIKTDAAIYYDLGNLYAPINLVMFPRLRTVRADMEEIEKMRAAAAQFTATGYEVAQPGKHPGLPKPRPTVSPAESPAEKPVRVAVK
jgi:hypothetical protein